MYNRTDGNGGRSTIRNFKIQVNKKLSFRYIKYEVSIRHPRRDVNRLLDL